MCWREVMRQRPRFSPIVKILFYLISMFIIFIYIYGYNLQNHDPPIVQAEKTLIQYAKDKNIDIEKDKIKCRSMDELILEAPIYSAFGCRSKIVNSVDELYIVSYFGFRDQPETWEVVGSDE